MAVKMFKPVEFDEMAAKLEESIARVFKDVPQDPRKLALLDLLLAQLKVCSLHYKLMQLEEGNRLSINGADLSDLVSRQLELAKFFRDLPKSSENPTYEMKSIITLYRFISHHIGRDETE